MNINIEDFKLLAEFMGYEVRKSVDSHCIELDGGLWIVGMPNVYNPRIDFRQMVEIMEKLIKAGALLDGCHIEDENNFMIWMDDPERRWEGKTINEAVVNAAIAMVKDE